MAGWPKAHIFVLYAMWVGWRMYNLCMLRFYLICPFSVQFVYIFFIYISAVVSWHRAGCHVVFVLHRFVLLGLRAFCTISLGGVLIHFFKQVDGRVTPSGVFACFHKGVLFGNPCPKPGTITYLSLRFAWLLAKSMRFYWLFEAAFVSGPLSFNLILSYFILFYLSLFTTPVPRRLLKGTRCRCIYKVFRGAEFLAEFAKNSTTIALLKVTSTATPEHWEAMSGCAQNYAMYINTKNMSYPTQ